MSPPTEQLIRDYLNRLSVAARGRLGAEDRRALVNRTHDFIDRNASRSGPATSMQVAALLSRLGDPSVLVDQEVARLAATRGDDAAAAPVKPGLRDRLRRSTGQASWHWPVVTGSPDLQSKLFGGRPPAPNGVVKATPAGSPPALVPLQGGPVDEPAAGPAADAPARPADAPAGRENIPADPGEPPARAPGTPARQPAAVTGGTDGRPEPDRPEPDRPAWPATAALSAGLRPAQAGTGAGSATTAAAESASRLAARMQPASVLAAGRGLWTQVAASARRHPGEAVALTLLGLGGVLYPPVWLLGAVGVLIARGWNYRDRWIGLACPVLVLVLITACGVMLGPAHARASGYVHEAWLYADILSRLGAVAGATYLSWRLGHPWRVPEVPPWNKPHKVD
jgi:hypothetical protein